MIRSITLTLVLMLMIQGCGTQAPAAETSPVVPPEAPTLKAMPTDTETPPTATSTWTPVPIDDYIDPTPDPFAFLFDKFEMKTEMVGWGTIFIQDASGDTLNKLVHTLDGGITWLDITPPSDDPYRGLDDTDFLDADHAWVVQPFESEAISDFHPIVWRTSNGGADWEMLPTPVTLPSRPIARYSVHFEDEDHGYLIVPNNVAAGTTSYSVFATSDGGAHWQQQPDETVNLMSETDLLSTLPQPEGVDTSGGCWDYQELRTVISDREQILQFSCDEHLLIYHSHDGGKTWDKPYVRGPLFVAKLTDFVDVATGWFKGSEDSPSNTKGNGLYITHDGGKTWSEITPVINIENLDPAQYPNGNPMELIDDFNFLDARTGLARSDYWYDYSLMLKTTDGGLTWSSWVPHWQPATR